MKGVNGVSLCPLTPHPDSCRPPTLDCSVDLSLELDQLSLDPTLPGLLSSTPSPPAPPPLSPHTPTTPHKLDDTSLSIQSLPNSPLLHQNPLPETLEAQNDEALLPSAGCSGSDTFYAVCSFTRLSFTHTRTPGPQDEGPERSKVTYSMIGGLNAQLQTIQETIELPLKHPEMFKKYGECSGPGDGGGACTSLRPFLF